LCVLLLLFLLLLRSFAGAAGVAAALQSAAVAADAAVQVSAAVEHIAAVAAAAHLEDKEAPSPFVVLVPCSTSISKQTLPTSAFQNVLSDDAGDPCLREVDGTSNTGMQLVQGVL
jgi:hypothetical protein